MKHIILKVLNRHKNGQFNMGSEAAREMLATEIEAVLISNELLSKHLNAITINVFTNVTCLVVFGIIIIYRFNIDFPSNNLGWSYIIFASLFYCVAFYSQLFAVNNMGSARTALLLYMEPIVAIFSAIILLNETLSMIQIIGVGLVITSLILTTRRIKNTIS